MERRRGPPSQGWRTFLHNHAPQIAAIDLFVVPTIGFKLLYGLAILHLERRLLILTAVTANPTAEWISRQTTEAYPWDREPRHLIRDRDSSYGRSSPKGSGLWASEIDQSLLTRRGKTAMSNG